MMFRMMLIVLFLLFIVSCGEKPGSTENSSEAVVLPDLELTDMNTLPLDAWKSASAGHYHTAAIKVDGTLWAWGYNLYGQLGDGTKVDRYTPIQIGNESDWQVVSCGNTHTLGLKTDGTLWAWGSNTYGQLGDGSKTSYYTPRQIDADSDWSSIATGLFYSLALKKDGSLWAWGNNYNGQLGDGSNENKNIPVQIGEESDWKFIASKNKHTLAIKNDGSLWGWGNNYYSQLGDDSTESKNSPVQIALAIDSNGEEVDGINSKWTGVSCGSNHSMGVQEDGTIWGWGDDQYGQTGWNNLSTYKRVPTQIKNYFTDIHTDWIDIFTGKNHSFGLKKDGSLWSWGDGQYNQLGYTTNFTSGYTSGNSAHQMKEKGSWDVVSSGFNHTVGIKEDGTLWVWGNNDYGQLGNGNLNDEDYPRRIGINVEINNVWREVFAGTYNSFGIKVDGTLWGWGDNGYGKLGDGSTVAKNIPVQIGNDTWRSISSSILHTAGIKTDGTLWRWGHPYSDPLIYVDVPLITEPTQVGSESGWKSVATGTRHALALKEDGTIWSWGSDANNQLGNGSGIDSMEPVLVEGLSSVSDQVIIDATTFSSFVVSDALAVDSYVYSGTVWGWGVYSLESLNPTPRELSNSIYWRSFSVGSSHAVGIRAGGDLFVWGNNNQGQLGQGREADDLSFPYYLDIVNKPKWRSSDAQGNTSAGIRDDGSLWLWGRVLEQNDYFRNYGTVHHTPHKIESDISWKSISLGKDHYLGIKQDGSLWTWGENGSGQLGQGTNSKDYGPRSIDIRWQESPSKNFQLGVDSQGYLYAKGQNSSGQLGLGDLIDRTESVKLAQSYGIKQFSLSNQHAAFIKANGTLWTWGNYEGGALGYGASEYVMLPTQVNAESDWSKVLCTEGMTLALKVDGRLYFFGTYKSNETVTEPMLLAKEIEDISIVGEGLYVKRDDGTIWRAR